MNEPGEEFAIYSHAGQGDEGLPPDPEGMNNQRSELAFYAMREFAQQSRTNPEFVLRDLMVDMMHWCDRHGESFADALDLATQSYQEEITPLDFGPAPESPFPIQASLEPTNPTNEVKMPF